MTYQIPPETVDFIDRDEERARALRAVAEWDEPSRPLWIALSGLGGVGKTELGLHLARRLRDRFADGVLYLDLDELRRDGVVDVLDVLGDLLGPLSDGSDWLNLSLGARRRQYWRLTEGKRLLVFVDNVRYGSEVQPLLPASGSSTVIVASQGPLYDLPDGGGVELRLGPLDDAHALRLLRSVVDDPRLDAEPEAVARLLRLCSGLPVALHVAARLVRKHRRRPLARLLATFTAELEERGLPMVDQVWDAAYRDLGPEAALLYRFLGAAPDAPLSPAAAAALLGRGAEAAEDAIEELETAGLLEPRGDHKRVPGPLRAHARRRARHDADEDQLAQARRRIVRWYLRQAQRADLIAAGSRLTLGEPVPALPDAPDVDFGPGDAAKTRALRWLEEERHALYAGVRLAHEHGLDAEAWALCEPLWTHFLDHKRYADTVDAFRTGVAAAQRAGHVPALIRMRCQLARALWERGDVSEAGEEMTRAGTATAALGDSAPERKLAASVREFTGSLRSVGGDWAGAAEEFEAARQVHLAIGNRYGAALQTYRLGEALAELGELDRAAELLAAAHEAMAGELGRPRMAARTGFALAGVLRRRGRLDAARVLYEESLTAARARGSSYDEARVLDALGALAEEAGEEEAAAEHRELAHAIRRRNGVDG